MPSGTNAHNCCPLSLPPPQVVAASNAKLQAIVAKAKAAYKDGTPFDGIAALVQISAIAAVQQQEMAQSISELAAKIASDPSIDIPAEAAQLESVSGELTAACWGACSWNLG